MNEWQLFLHIYIEKEHENADYPDDDTVFYMKYKMINWKNYQNQDSLFESNNHLNKNGRDFIHKKQSQTATLKS